METDVKTKGAYNRFSIYQHHMAKRIFKLIMEEEFEKLAVVIKSIPNKHDYEKIHYAFYFEYDASWLSLVEKFCGYEVCNELGLYEYNFD